MIIRREAFKAAALATDSKDSRFLQAMEVQPDGSVRSTNGNIALIARNRHPMPDEHFPTAGIPKFHGNPEKAILIPAETAARLVGATPKGKCRIPILTGIQIGTNGDGSTFAAATDLVAPMVAKINTSTDQTFPNLDRVMPPSTRPVRTVILAANMLETIAKASALVARKGLKTKGAVRLEIPYEPESYRTREGDRVHVDGCDHVGCDCPRSTEVGELEVAIKFTITGEDVEITGVVMPCRDIQPAGSLRRR